MPTPARKVSLVSVNDYPRDEYRAYYQISVVGSAVEGLAWRVVFNSIKPIGYRWNGETSPEWPSDDKGNPVVAKPMPAQVPVRQAEYSKMSPADQAKVRLAQAAWRKACGEVAKQNPVPLFELADFAGAILPDEVPEDVKAQGGDAMARWMRDAADTAAQELVIREMPQYKLPAPPPNKQAGHALALGPGWMVWEILRELGRRLFGPLLAIAYSSTIRTARLADVGDAIDGGAGAGLIRIYDSSRPATCGTATTLLAQLTCSDPCFTTNTGGVATFDAITDDSSADNTGTATWFRAVDSTGTCCMDGDVGTSGSDMNINNTSIAATQTVSISSATITEGNP